MKSIVVLFVLALTSVSSAKECSKENYKTAYKKALAIMLQLSTESAERSTFVFSPETSKLTVDELREGYKKLLKASKGSPLIDALVEFQKKHPECELKDLN